jgi:hypothetical protein
VDAIAEHYGEQPKRALADGAFSTGPNLAGMEERGIEFLSPLASGDLCENNPAYRPDPTTPVAEDQLDSLPRDKQTKKFSKEAFVYDKQQDRYYCPQGRVLKFAYSEIRQLQGQKVTRYTYQTETCQGCPLIDRCRKDPHSKSGRRVTRDEYEEIRQRHRIKMSQADANKRYQRRLHYGETPFAFIKGYFNLRRFLLTGIEGVRQEWSWATLAFNFKKFYHVTGVLRAEGNILAIAQEK